MYFGTAMGNNKSDHLIIGKSCSLHGKMFTCPILQVSSNQFIKAY
jgi:hypothetical protein